MNAVFSVALPVFALVLAGFVVERFGLLGGQSAATLNRFVVWLALPALLFRVTAGAQFGDLLDLGYNGAYGGGLALTFGAALLLERRAGGRTERGIRALSASFANTGFMGLPLVQLAYGQAGLLPAVASVLLVTCVLFGVGIAFIESERQTGGLLRVVWVLARNPLLVAPGIGILVSVSGVGVPPALDRFAGLLAGAATPCALVSLGCFIALQKGGFAWPVVARLSALKLLLQPAVTWVLAVHVFRLPGIWAEIAVLTAALPTGIGPFTLASTYGRGGCRPPGRSWSRRCCPS